MKHVNFTEGKIYTPLVKFTVPILLSILLQAMYGAVDLLVIGQFGDASSVSAVATGSQMMQTITGIISGLSMGTTVILGQKIGEKRMDDAAKTVGTSICLFTTVAIIVGALMMIAARPFSRFMNAPVEAFDKTVQYVLICASGTVFIAAYNVISGILRGIGNSKLPLIFVSIACVVNIIGDFLLVGVFGLDVAGAAIATVFAQAVSVALSVLIIKKQGLPFSLTKESVKFQKKETLLILRTGSPIAFQDALTSISFLIITSIINSMGLIASAAMGVAEKIIIFIMLVPMSFMSSVSAFVAQNIGAQKPERAMKTMYYAMGTSLFFGTALFLLTFLHGEILTGLFSREPEVIAASAEYMKAYAIDCVLVCFLFCFMGFFNGCGKTMFVMLQGVLAAFLVRIPYSYFVSKLPGATMLQVGLASPVATVFGVILCAIYFLRIRKKMNLNPLT